LNLKYKAKPPPKAAEALTQLEGLEAEWQSAETEPTRELTLATIVTVVGLAKTALEIAKLIHDWYAQRKPQGKIEKVILKSRSGKRINLHNAGVEDIKKILDS